MATDVSPPTFAGTVARQATYADAANTPYAGTVISDPTPDARDIVLIQAFSRPGILSDGPGFSGLTLQPPPSSDTSYATYYFSGTPSQVTAELDALRYAPTSFGIFTQLETSVTDTATKRSSSEIVFVEDLPTADSVAIEPAAMLGSGGAIQLTAVSGNGVEVAGVEFSAEVDGVERDLGSAAAADGGYVFVDPIGAGTQSFITATLTDTFGNAVSTVAPFSLTGGITGKPYVAEEDVYAPNGGAVLFSTYLRPDGTRAVDLHVGGQTLASDQFDTFFGHGAPDDTFVFSPGFGLDTVRGFRLAGPDHDTLSLSARDFGFGSLGAVLASAQDGPGGLTISDPTSGDTLKLAGVTKSQLANHPGDVAFHP